MIVETDTAEIRKGEHLENNLDLIHTTGAMHVQYVHYMSKSMWTPARQTSHSKIMGINMELVPRLLL